MEQVVSSHLRRWLRVQRNLTNIALYSTTAKLQLPTTSITGEFKVAKTRIYIMVRDSEDAVIMTAQLQVPTTKKWDVAKTVVEVGSRLQMKEIAGATQADRQGCQKNKI